MRKRGAIDLLALGALGLVCVLAFAELAPSDGDRAAQAYEAAKNSGASDTQLCRSARAVQDAYAAEGDAVEAENWDGWAKIHCLGASFNEGYQDPKLREQSIRALDRPR